MRLKTVFFYIVGMLLLIIFLQNTQVVDFRILFWKVSMSRIILLPMLVLIGFGIGFFVGKHQE